MKALWISGLAVLLLSEGAIVAGNVEPVAAVQVALTPGRVTGELNENSETLNDGSYFAVHQFEGRTGEWVAIELNSEEFDPYLLLLAPNGEWIAANDDGGEGNNARIVLELPETGRYRIWANSYQVGETGGYELLWRESTVAEVLAAEQKAEADRLLDLGNEQYDISQFREALASWEAALEIYRAIGDREGETDSLGHLGIAYGSLGQYEQAINCFQQSLTIAREIRDRRGEATSLGNLGNAYFLLGQYKQAIDYQQQQLEISREIRDRGGEAVSLGNLGNAYQYLGQYEQAIDFHQQSLVIKREIRDRRGEAASLGNLGRAYETLGQYERAIDFFQQTLEIAREIRDRLWEAASLGNLGNAYQYLGQYEQAIDFYQQSLIIKREIGDRRGEATSLGNLGRAYETLGQYERAIDFSQQQLEIARAIGNRLGEIQSLENFGIVYGSLGQYEHAIDFFQQQLEIAREIGYREGEAMSLDLLAVALQNTNQPELAIVFYKQSVNTYEAIRTDLTSLPTEDQQTYADKVAKTYDNLADLLFQQGRPLEAQRVLDLLRVQQIDDYLRGIRGNANTRDGIDLFEVEEAFKALYDRYLNELVGLRRELSALQDISPTERSATQEQRRQALEADLANADRTFSRFARQPEVRNLVSQLQNLTIGETLTPKQLENLGKDLDRFLGNVALLSNFSFEERLEIVVTAANGLTVNVPIEISRVELNTLVGEFRTALADRTSDPLPLAQQLYGYLFAALEDTFREQGIDAIVYAPNGILAYIPLAALHDGESWLAQRYPVNQITALSLTNPRQPRQTEELSVLAGAFPSDDQSFLFSDRIYDYSGLPFAALEVDRILELLPNTTALRDGEFSLEAIVSQMTDYGILHLATHAEFVVGEPEESFILFGNGDRANFIELEGWELPNTDIVVLSACETAVGGVLGDGSEMLGFGYLMQEAGAQVSIASLWQVSDGGTQEFMGHFYEALQEVGITRAEALRQAQVAMIRRGEGDEGGDRRCSLCPPEGGDGETGRRVSAGHPYYWAPFVLIGNGL